MIWKVLFSVQELGDHIHVLMLMTIYHDKTHAYDQGKNSQRPRNYYPNHFACKLLNNNNNNHLSLWHTSN
jgi:hypothetical protein